MLINLSNHPVANWSAQQITAAGVYGTLIDLPFPDVDPSGDEEYLRILRDEYLRKIDEICGDGARPVSTITVHIMGEMTFTFAMVKALQKRGITCVASTTGRVSSEENGVKTSEFRFVHFRKYQ
jgi:hypothetical protein